MAGRFPFASTVAAAAAALLAMPAFATELDRDCTRDTAGRAASVIALHTAVDSIFDDAAAREAADPAAELTTMEVVMIRIVDGKPVMACVDNKEAANRFLNAPAEKLAGKAKAEEK